MCRVFTPKPRAADLNLMHAPFMGQRCTKLPCREVGWHLEVQMWKLELQDAFYQFGIGGCRAPEVPDPFSFPTREIPWDEALRKEPVRKIKAPIYPYAY